ncbi:hypothetical protein PRIEUP_LOCUS293, partial [Pristimantis euphronides]
MNSRCITDPRWLQARWARVLEAARPLAPAVSAAEAQETSEESSGANERTEGRVGAAGGPAGLSQPGKSNSTSNLQTVANVGSSGGKRKRGSIGERREHKEDLQVWSSFLRGFQRTNVDDGSYGREFPMGALHRRGRWYTVRRLPKRKLECGKNGQKKLDIGRFRGPPGLVWIIGHSYVYWGAQLADRRWEGRQLGISREVARVRWIGVRGMQWGRMLGEVQRFVNLDWKPNIIVLHAGGNDIGKRPCRELARDIKYDILRLWQLYPETIVAWLEIVRRKKWRNGGKVSRLVSAFVVRNGGITVRHRELEAPGANYWRSDGVHLTEVGLAFWLLNIQQGVERAVA